MQLALCAYHWAGAKVLKHVLARSDIGDVAVFTHEAPAHVPDVVPIAKAAGVFVTTASVNRMRDWPFVPDILACVYYRHILKPPVLAACEGRAFNLHPSLLPRHRGCSSVPWALIEGDSVTGISYHYIDAGIDTGHLLLQASVQILPNDTQATLYQRCMARGVAFWPAAFELVKAGVPGVPQLGEPSYHPRACPHNGEISADWPREQIERFIRAMIFPPLPPATWHGQPVRNMDEFDLLDATGFTPTPADEIRTENRHQRPLG